MIIRWLMILLSSIAAKKSFENLFRVETLTKVGTKGTYLSTTKATYDERTANIILDGKLKASLKAETRQACPLSPLLFNIALEFLATVIREEKKTYPTWKGRGKTVTMCRWHDTIYIENSRDSTQELLKLINEFNRVAGCKISIQKYVAFLYTNNEVSEKESKKKKSCLESNKKKRTKEATK